MAIYIITAVLAIALIISLAARPKTVTLCEPKPENGKRPVDRVLKLSDQLSKYVKEKDGKIYIKIVL